MRRERKSGPFIPSEVRAHTGPARATTPAPAHRRHRATRAVGARAKRPRSSDDVYARAVMPAPARERMRTGDNVCACATTGGAWEGCFFTNTPNFSAPATMSASGQQRLHPGDDVRMRSGDNACAWATTSACVGRRVPRGRSVFSQTPQTSTLGRQRLRPGDNACARATTSALAQ